MAKYLKNIGQYRVYEPTYEEAKEHGRVYPTFVCWYHDDDDIGNMNSTLNETECIEEMVCWCKG